MSRCVIRMILEGQSGKQLGGKSKGQPPGTDWRTINGAKVLVSGKTGTPIGGGAAASKIRGSAGGKTHVPGVGNSKDGLGAIGPSRDYVNNLEPDDVKVLDEWFDMGYENMRMVQATGTTLNHHPIDGSTLSPKDKAKIKRDAYEIERIVEDAPDFRGLGYRGMANLSDADAAALSTPGAEISMKANSSWTASKDVAEQFTAGDADIPGQRILMVSNGGLRDLRAANEGERELFSPTRSKFRVISTSTKTIQTKNEEMESVTVKVLVVNVEHEG